MVVHVKYYVSTWECSKGGDYVRTYIIGMMALLSVVIVVLVALVNRSAQGSITNVDARKHVPPILLLKMFLIIPECVLNVFGTMWAFCGDLVVCPYEGHFSRTVIEGIVLFVAVRRNSVKNAAEFVRCRFLLPVAPRNYKIERVSTVPSYTFSV